MSEYLMDAASEGACSYRQCAPVKQYATKCECVEVQQQVLPEVETKAERLSQPLWKVKENPYVKSQCADNRVVQVGGPGETITAGYYLPSEGCDVMRPTDGTYITHMETGVPGIMQQNIGTMFQPTMVCEPVGCASQCYPVCQEAVVPEVIPPGPLGFQKPLPVGNTPDYPIMPSSQPIRHTRHYQSPYTNIAYSQC